jgi:23S rRNA pseudouridine1911/1915/1917 synthase
MKEKFEILFEDDAVIAINKPAGVVVNRAVSATDTVADWAFDYINIQKYSPESDMYLRCGVAHRLDKETSGVLLIGKTPEALASLMAQFKDRKTEKEYLAFVHGRLEPKEGEMRLPIRRDPWNRKKWGVHFDGKDAQTRWSVQDWYLDQHGQQYSLVKLFPKTGRTHQIRVHMVFLSHPLLSDERYLNRKRYLKDKEVLGRHFLHACSIEFFHPTTGLKTRIEAPLPADLVKTLGMFHRTD